MEWYYITDAKERLPFDEGEELELVAGGLIRPKTMVWNAGMEAWAAASEVRPEWFRAGKEGDRVVVGREETVVKEVGRALAEQRGWWAVAGVMAVVWGLLLVAWAVMVGMRREMVDLVIGLVLLPHAVSVFLGGLGMIRGMFGVARAAELGQRSKLVGEAGRVARSVRTVAIGLVLTVIFGAVAVALGAVFYWEVVEAYFGWGLE